jgi:hypothetical protein
MKGVQAMLLILAMTSQSCGVQLPNLAENRVRTSEMFLKEICGFPGS